MLKTGGNPKTLAPRDSLVLRILSVLANPPPPRQRMAPRTRTLRAVGATDLVSTTVVALFFLLYAISTTLDRLAILSIVSIVAAVLNIGSCVPITLFAISPSTRGRALRLSGILPCLIAVVVSACVLGWMGLRQQYLPKLILGQNSAHVLLAGFAVFIVMVVLHSVFWTVLLLSTPNPIKNDRESNPPATTTLCRCAHRSVDVAFPSPTLCASKSSLGSTIRVPKHRSFIAKVYRPTAPKGKGHGSLYTIEDKDVQSMATVVSHRSPRAEFKHFDDWDTSDLSAKERVAASLAAIQQEEAEEAIKGLGITTTIKHDPATINGRPTSSIYSSEHSVPERRSSPPLPENDVASPSSFRRDAFQFPVNAVLTSPVSTRFPLRAERSFRSGRDMETASQKSDRVNEGLFMT